VCGVAVRGEAMKTMARTLRLARATIFATFVFAAACSDDPASDGDSGTLADASNDAGAADLPADDAPNDGAVTDASLDFTLDAAGDAMSDEAAADGEEACACALVDGGAPAPLPPNGVMSLPCYCAMPWPGFPGAPECESYEVATRCDGARPGFSVETYTNCNLVTVRYGGHLGVDARVYDHTSLELVGAYRGTDHSIPCGASQAFMMLSGIIPGPECQTAKIEWPCVDAGRVDGSAGDAAPPHDADGGCACEPDEQNIGGRMSLACYCEGGCLTYDQALTRCASDAPPAFNRVDDYEACNLVLMTFGGNIPGGGVYVFDRTTHDLVGASSGADYPAFKCGDASVFGYRAGTFPPPGCTVSRSVPRCPPVDGG
jgi:hypothetical protein